MILNSPYISGSITVTGNANIQGTISGSVSGTATNAVTASYAATASSADNLLVRNTLTAQTLVVQTITSSVDFVTGSTRFGSIIGNTHQFTGSVGISGSTSLAGALSGTSATFSGTLTATQASFTATANTYAGGSLIIKAFGGTNPIYLTSVGGLFALSNGGSADHLIITSTGAATFDNYVGVGGSISGNYPLTIRSKVADYTKILDWGTSAGGSWGTMTINTSAPYNTIFNSGGFAFTGGNVGIGTTSPTSRLQIEGTGAGAWLTINRTDAGTNIIDFTQSGTRLGYVGYIGNDLTLNNATSSNTIFSTNNTERMRITSGGQVLIGKTTTTIDDGDGVRIDSDGTMFAIIPNVESTYYVRDITNAVYRFRVSGAGTIFATNTTISSISDERLKENIEDLDIGLDAVMALRPRKFDWKKESGNTGKDVRGFIAQEVETIFPDLIDLSEKNNEDEIEYKSLRQDFIPILVKAIQEQNQLIQELQSQNDTLQTRIEQLEQR